jgi:hypothetical protein
MFIDPSVIDTVHTSRLRMRSPRFIRYHGRGRIYRYQLIQLIPSETALFTFLIGSRVRTYGYLYKQMFASSSPTHNLLIYNDRMDGDQRYQFQYQLEADTVYYLAVTTARARQYAEFTVVVSGSTSVQMKAMSSRLLFVYRCSRNHH